MQFSREELMVNAVLKRGIDGECSSQERDEEGREGRGGKRGTRREERDEEGRKHSTKRLLLLSELCFGCFGSEWASPVCYVRDERYYAIYTALLSRPPLNIIMHRSVPQLLLMLTNLRALLKGGHVWSGKHYSRD
jgi:hypothetical protein